MYLCEITPYSIISCDNNVEIELPRPFDEIQEDEGCNVIKEFQEKCDQQSAMEFEREYLEMMGERGEEIQIHFLNIDYLRAQKDLFLQKTNQEKIQEEVIERTDIQVDQSLNTINKTMSQLPGEIVEKKLKTEGESKNNNTTHEPDNNRNRATGNNKYQSKRIEKSIQKVKNQEQLQQTFYVHNISRDESENDQDISTQEIIKKINGELKLNGFPEKMFVNEQFFTGINGRKQLGENFKEIIMKLSNPTTNNPSRLYLFLVSMAIIGLTARNLSSMLNGAGVHIGEAIDALETRAKTFQGLIEKNGFSASNLSSMLSCAGTHIGEGIDALGAHAKTLEGLIEKNGFSASNLSSMLSGAGAHISKAIEALETRASVLEGLIEKNGFSASNLSSILDRAGAHIGKAIDALKTHAPILEGLIEKNGFSASNLSSMLSCAGAHIGEAINELSQSDVQKKLGDLLSCGFSAENLSTILSTSGVKIKKKLDNVYAFREDFTAFINDTGLTATNIAGLLARDRDTTKGSIENLIKEIRETQNKIQTGLDEELRKQSIEVEFALSKRRQKQTLSTNTPASELDSALEYFYDIATAFRRKEVSLHELNACVLEIKILNKAHFTMLDNNALKPAGDFRGNLLAFSADSKSKDPDQLKYYSYQKISRELDDKIELGPKGSPQRENIAEGLRCVLFGQFLTASGYFKQAGLNNDQAISLAKLATILLAEKTRAIKGGHGRLTLFKAIQNITVAPNFSAIFSHQEFLTKFKKTFLDDVSAENIGTQVQNNQKIIKEKLHAKNLNKIFEEEEAFEEDKTNAPSMYAKFAYPGGGALRFRVKGDTSDDEPTTSKIKGQWEKAKYQWPDKAIFE